MKNFLKSLFVAIFAIIAITVTVLLLSYNGYKCSVIGGYTFYMPAEDIDDNYLAGDLLIIKNTNVNKLEKGDKVFVYNNISTSEFNVILAEVGGIASSGTRKVITVNDDIQYDSMYLIGKEDDTIVYHKIGGILSLLESRWGYLFCIVVVTLLLLLQEVLDLIIELKYGKEEVKN